MAAKRKEIDSLVNQGTWKLFVKEEGPLGFNVISGRFVMSIKDVETDKPYFKARL